MMMRSKKWLALSAMAVLAALSVRLLAESPAMENRKAGTMVDGALVEADGKLVHGAGTSMKVPGAPVDVLFTPDGSLMLVKSGRGLSIVNPKTSEVLQTLTFKDFGGSMHGLAVMAAAAGKGWTAYFTSSAKGILEANIAADGKADWGRKITLNSGQNWGVALSPDGKFAYVCASVTNKLVVVDLTEGKVAAEIPVGVSPYDVAISPDGGTAYVTNFGGSHPRAGQASQKSVGTDVLVDSRDIPNSGTVSKVDLNTRKATGEIATGLHPTQIVRTARGDRYFVADANSDTVSVIDADKNAVVESISVRPDPKLPFGSIPNGLTLSADEKTLYVANAGNDAVAVIGLGGEKSELRGFIPVGWYPSGVACSGEKVFIANCKSGSITSLPMPTADQLKNYTSRVMADERLPQTLREMARAESGVKPVPVPAHPDEPSVFKHVVFVLKENKTYDQVLGDIGKGNSEPKYCTYGQNITPNQHAMASQFVLLDNYYCNGVNSSEGHQWAVQGIISEYFQKVGSRTYDFGTDALCYANCDFIWDSCLLHGLSIRNYGEFDFPEATTKQNWFDIYNQWKTTGTMSFKQSVQFGTLMKYTCHEYPGWNLDFPDVCRAKVFMDELKGFEKSGDLPNFVLVYLPQDHTAGRGQKVPTPRAMVADNDLATGQVVDAISKSKFWKDTCIIINEDDPQSGSDHVDGHRSICLVVSPYTRRQAVVSKFYNQTSVLHTMTRMLGLPPLNQAVAEASTMEDCFTNTPDMRPFDCITNTVALDEKNPSRQAMGKEERDLADAVDQMNFTRPDLADDDKMNRLAWIASGRTEPYPAAFSGPHGKGLAALHLKLVKDNDGDDDDD
jgi:YVTN family beta-propeller protein